MIAAAYLAALDFVEPLAEELARRGAGVLGWHGRLALSPDPPIEAAWALDTWTAPVELAAPSVKAASDALRAIQRNWSGYAAAHHRRSALITARLPPVKAAPLVFPSLPPAGHLGAWTLLTAGTLLASPAKTNPFVLGECHFVEDHIGPPSRAYLKLWEALVRLGCWPGPGARCVDLGASPGGWTWVLASLGADVLAIDRAPLADSVAAMRGVATRIDDAFRVAPAELGPIDWLVCDVIAYPARLFDLVARWIAAGTAERIICTIKFQGSGDHAVADEFARLSGARMRRLFHNKHELTFTWARTSFE